VTDPLRVNLYLPKKGVVPGETIVLAGELENKTNSTIKGHKLQIVQVWLTKFVTGVVII